MNTPAQLLNGQSHVLTFKVSGCSAYQFGNSPRTLNACGSPRKAIQEPEPNKVVESADLFVSPNPGTGIFEVRFYLEKGKKATVSVLDILGKPVSRKTVTGNGQHKESVNISGKASGNYFIQVQKGNQLLTKRIILIK